ncbi:MAG: zinc transporter ZupT [Alphaproteobacteria bacterium]|nr:zinc transporter ZupT [Alphaproteobacteria bacterium]
MEQQVITAFSLTLFAGLATVIGSAFAYFVRKSDGTFFSLSMGFSAGMMIYLSFVEILPEAVEALNRSYGGHAGEKVALVAFFAGMLLIMFIDVFVPDYENPHHIVDEGAKGCGCNDKGKHVVALKGKGSGGEDCCIRNNKLMRLGVFSALAIAIHNFPEGIATFIAALEDTQVGIKIAIAIAIHNIPEGIAISIPIYCATKSRRKAFWYSFLSGMSEPLGALLGYLILRPYISETLMGVMLAAVSGIMVFISLDGLIPAAHKYGKSHVTVYGIVTGMAVIAYSILLF